MNVRQWLLEAFGALIIVSTALAAPQPAAADEKRKNSGDTGDAVSIATASPSR